MVVVGLWLMPSGLFQYAFLSDYWHPPSLFDLGQRYGFDLESLVYAFSASSAMLALYGLLQEKVFGHEWADPLRLKEGAIYFGIALVVFSLLYGVGLNSIYASHVALAAAPVYAMWRLPGHLRIVAILTGFFTLYYTLAFVALDIGAPGFIETYWSLHKLSDVFLFNIPLEEVLFGLLSGPFYTMLAATLLNPPEGCTATGPSTPGG